MSRNCPDCGADISLGSFHKADCPSLAFASRERRDDEGLPLIGVIAKLDLKPTDIVVLKSDKELSRQTCIRIEEYFRARLRIDNKIIVLDGLDIQVMSPAEESAA